MSTDLLHSEERKSMVREAYQAVVSTGGAVACNLYDSRQLALVPELARDIALGVANHMAHADILSGDTVLAAAAVGPTGKVYALDFLPEMLQRTALAAAAAHVGDVVQTVEGEMEAIPLPDESVDVIISNGVINLSPRKSRVFAECARVLRPGGRFCVSDITIVEEQLPPEVLVHPAAWAG